MSKLILALGLLFSSLAAHAGGSNGVMVVNRKDAEFRVDSQKIRHFIFLEPEVYNTLWTGMVEEEFGYMRIGFCSFTLLFDDRSGIITAFGFLGRSYEVREWSHRSNAEWDGDIYDVSEVESWQAQMEDQQGY